VAGNRELCTQWGSWSTSSPHWPLRRRRSGKTTYPLRNSLLATSAQPAIGIVKIEIASAMKERDQPLQL